MGWQQRRATARTCQLLSMTGKALEPSANHKRSQSQWPAWAESSPCALPLHEPSLPKLKPPMCVFCVGILLFRETQKNTHKMPRLPVQLLLRRASSARIDVMAAVPTCAS